jgi:hypothetical protein
VSQDEEAGGPEHRSKTVHQVRLGLLAKDGKIKSKRKCKRERGERE